MYLELHNLDKTLEVGDDTRRTYGIRQRGCKSTNIYVISRGDTCICIRRTNLYPNAICTSTRLHGGHRSGGNSHLMVTVTRYNKLYGHNHDCIAIDDGYSKVTAIDWVATTTGFLVASIVVASGDETLVPKNNVILRTTPNVELPILYHSRHVVHSAVENW